MGQRNTKIQDTGTDPPSHWNVNWSSRYYDEDWQRTVSNPDIRSTSKDIKRKSNKTNAPTKSGSKDLSIKECCTNCDSCSSTNTKNNTSPSKKKVKKKQKPKKQNSKNENIKEIEIIFDTCNSSPSFKQDCNYCNDRYSNILTSKGSSCKSCCDTILGRSNDAVARQSLHKRKSTDKGVEPIKSKEFNCSRAPSKNTMHDKQKRHNKIKEITKSKTEPCCEIWEKNKFFDSEWADKEIYSKPICFEEESKGCDSRAMQKQEWKPKETKINTQIEGEKSCDNCDKEEFYNCEWDKRTIGTPKGFQKCSANICGVTESTEEKLTQKEKNNENKKEAVTFDTVEKINTYSQTDEEVKPKTIKVLTKCEPPAVNFICFDGSISDLQNVDTTKLGRCTCHAQESSNKDSPCCCNEISSKDSKTFWKQMVCFFR